MMREMMGGHDDSMDDDPFSRDPFGGMMGGGMMGNMVSLLKVSARKRKHARFRQACAL